MNSDKCRFLYIFSCFGGSQQENKGIFFLNEAIKQLKSNVQTIAGFSLFGSIKINERIFIVKGAGEEGGGEF